MSVFKLKSVVYFLKELEIVINTLSFASRCALFKFLTHCVANTWVYLQTKHSHPVTNPSLSGYGL